MQRIFGTILVNGIKVCTPKQSDLLSFGLIDALFDHVTGAWRDAALKGCAKILNGVLAVPDLLSSLMPHHCNVFLSVLKKIIFLHFLATTKLIIISVCCPVFLFSTRDSGL